VRDLAHPFVFIQASDIPLQVSDWRSISQLGEVPLVLADIRRRKIQAEYIDIRYRDQIIVKVKEAQEMGLESQAEKG
jgi:hypothetical protein